MSSPPTVPACWKPIVKQIPKQPLRATPADLAKAIGASLKNVVNVARTELNQAAGNVAEILAMTATLEDANRKQAAEITALKAEVEEGKTGLERAAKWAKAIIVKVGGLEGEVQRQDDVFKEANRLNAVELLAEKTKNTKYVQRVWILFSPRACVCTILRACVFLPPPSSSSQALDEDHGTHRRRQEAERRCHGGQAEV